MDTEHNGRGAIIKIAAEEWNDTPGLQSITARDTFIDDALREAGFPLLTDDEKKAVPQPDGRAEQALAVMEGAGKEWDESHVLQATTTRAAFINDALQQAGLSPLTEDEASTVPSRQSDQARAIGDIAGWEWDHSPELQNLTGKDAYIQGAMHEAGVQK